MADTVSQQEAQTAKNFLTALGRSVGFTQPSDSMADDLFHNVDTATVMTALAAIGSSPANLNNPASIIDKLITAGGGNSRSNALPANFQNALKPIYDKAMQSGDPSDPQVQSIIRLYRGLDRFNGTWVRSRDTDGASYIANSTQAADMDIARVRSAFEVGHTAQQAHMDIEINQFVGLFGNLPEDQKRKLQFVAQHTEASQMRAFIATLKTYDKHGRQNTTSIPTGDGTSTTVAGDLPDDQSMLAAKPYDRNVASLSPELRAALQDALDKAKAAGGGTLPQGMASLQQALDVARNPAALALVDTTRTTPAATGATPASSPDTPPAALPPALDGSKGTFAANSVTLSDDYKHHLDALVESVKAGKKFVIRGYSSVDGNAADNNDLSILRAAEVKKYLLSKVPEADRARLDGNIITEGYGGEGKASDDPTQHRRAEIAAVRDDYTTRVTNGMPLTDPTRAHLPQHHTTPSSSGPSSGPAAAPPSTTTLPVTFAGRPLRDGQAEVVAAVRAGQGQVIRDDNGYAFRGPQGDIRARGGDLLNELERTPNGGDARLVLARTRVYDALHRVQTEHLDPRTATLEIQLAARQYYGDTAPAATQASAPVVLLPGTAPVIPVIREDLPATRTHTVIPHDQAKIELEGHARIEYPTARRLLDQLYATRNNPDIRDTALARARANVEAATNGYAAGGLTLAEAIQAIRQTASGYYSPQAAVLPAASSPNRGAYRSAMPVAITPPVAPPPAPGPTDLLGTLPKAPNAGVIAPATP